MNNKDNHLMFEGYIAHRAKKTIKEDLNQTIEPENVSEPSESESSSDEASIGEQIKASAEKALTSCEDNNDLHDDLQNIIRLAEELINGKEIPIKKVEPSKIGTDEEVLGNLRD